MEHINHLLWGFLFGASDGKDFLPATQDQGFRSCCKILRRKWKSTHICLETLKMRGACRGMNLEVSKSLVCYNTGKLFYKII